MHLYILMPYHGEGPEVYSPILSRINNQEYFDFSELTIVISRSDGVGMFPDLSSWDNIKDRAVFLSRKCPLPGPGWSRQVGYEYIWNKSNSDDDILLISDIDDDYVNDRAFYYIKDCMKNNPDADDITFAVDRFDVTTNTSNITHGYPWEIWTSVYRISFLKKYNIQHAKTCFTLEDAFFTVCRFSLPNIKHYYFDTPFYRYNMFRPQSTLNQAIGKTYPDAKYIQDAVNLAQEFEEWDPGVEKQKAILYDLVLQSVGHRIDKVDKSELSPETIEKVKTLVAQATEYQKHMETALEDVAHESKYSHLRDNYLKTMKEWCNTLEDKN